MLKFILLFLFIPLFAYSQNIITYMSMSKIEEYCQPIDASEYELYKIKISPGYRDHYYKFVLTQIDSSNIKKIIRQKKNIMNLRLNMDMQKVVEFNFLISFY